MALISLNEVSIAFAGPPLLDAVHLAIDDGERVGLLGRNGAGKSTLLQLLAGALPPDSGDVVRRPGMRVAVLQQDVPLDLAGTVREHLHAVCGAGTHERGWEIETRIDRALGDLTLDPDARIETLSAGAKRRVLLAAALVQEPDLLILDEPTNHLDLDAIRHLEQALERRRGTLVFVTHDRAFLRRLATRILDLDRGRLRSYRSGYDAYLVTRDEERRSEAISEALFDKRLAEEEAWIRRGIKARRTRNEGRVRELEALRRERLARRDDPGRVRAQLQEAERSGRVVLRARDAGFSFGDTPVVRGLDLTILRGDRIGILGPNGCGKTTLIRLLLGELATHTGTVSAGTRLEVAHFTQLHDSLDETKSVVDNVSGGREMLAVGAGERHVVGYLQDFLFSREQIQGPIGRLSGGERKRLQLAKVLSRPCNLLVLDEPTNDLDLETLELLEELLLEFQGTLLVVSHDRAFLDDVVTSTLVWEGGGRWREYVGGYEDWLRQTAPAEAPRAPKPASREGRSAPDRDVAKPRRAGFKEKRELDELPGHIETLETERAELFAHMSSPTFHTLRGDKIARATRRLAEVEAAIAAAYERWLELETLVRGETE